MPPQNFCRLTPPPAACCLQAAALLACTLLCGLAASQGTCDAPAHFTVPDVDECQLECSSRGAAKGAGWSGEPATYTSPSGSLCCECNFRSAETFKVVLMLGGTLYPLKLKHQLAVQDVLLGIVFEFWTWRHSQPLTVDSFDIGDEESPDGEPPGSRRRRLHQSDLADEAHEQWWPDVLDTTWLPADTPDGMLAYVDAALQAGKEELAAAELSDASSSGNLTELLRAAGVTVGDAAVLYAGLATPNMAAVLVGIDATSSDADSGSNNGAGADGRGSDDGSGSDDANGGTSEHGSDSDPVGGNGTGTTSIDSSNNGSDSTSSAQPTDAGSASESIIVPQGSESTTSSSTIIIAVAVAAGVLLVAVAGVAICVCQRRRAARYSRWEPPAAIPAPY